MFFLHMLLLVSSNLFTMILCIVFSVFHTEGLLRFLYLWVYSFRKSEKFPVFFYIFLPTLHLSIIDISEHVITPDKVRRGSVNFLLWLLKFFCASVWIVSFFFRDFIYLFLDRGEGQKKERERNINVWLPLRHPLLGTWPATQICALTAN